MIEKIREKIIDQSIKSLQQEGLRFSVDTLAEKLKISKKTVYKYFPTKEALAFAMYEKYYTDLAVRIKAITAAGGKSLQNELLYCYFTSSEMVYREIFNKYCLNAAIGEYALKHHAGVWEEIKPYLCGTITDDEADIYKTIVDGAFEKAIGNRTNPEKIIEILRRIK